ncbi:MAG: site-2 protease family protein [Actinobacteria bacterium]|nr:MAG: site-2 protease family protein [Actinomycetota bacterium]
MSYVLAFVGFALLIILHEAGHFTAAKAVGMRVERFSLFFPPLLFKVRRGETEYAIGSIPLGGYVRITGMNPTEEIPPEHQDRAYFRMPVWKRVVVISAGPLVNLVIAFVIFAGIFAIHGTFQTSNAVAKGGLKPPALGTLHPARAASRRSGPGSSAIAARARRARAASPRRRLAC